MNFKRLIVFSFLLVFLITFPISASPYQFGGKVSVGLNSTFFENQSNTSIYENVNLDLNFDNANFEILMSNNSVTEDFNITLKKAYIRHNYNNINIKLGKQPISWSFGSLLNPVDFSLGAEALDEETSAKYVNALELNYPINWYSNIAAVYEFNQNYDKYGIRGRTLIKDFDVSLNYVNQKSSSQFIKRFGLSVKGDIKNIGAYSSYTNVNFQKKVSSINVNTNALMVGADYSYFLNQGFGNRIYFQGEYHIIEKNEGLTVLLDSLAGAKVNIDQVEILEGDEYFEVFISNVSYNINDFSSIGLFTLTSLEDGSTALVPNYSNQLSTNTTLNIGAAYLSGEYSDVFYSPAVAVNVELSYTF